VADELTPETPGEETEEPIKQRKNGLYPGVSDELAENMKSGWADTELRDLEPIAQAAETAARRSALSARFPGERPAPLDRALVVLAEGAPMPVEQQVIRSTLVQPGRHAVEVEYPLAHVPDNATAARWRSDADRARRDLPVSSGR